MKIYRKKKEQLKILLGAIRDKLSIIKDTSNFASDTMIQNGLKLLNKIIDECLLDGVDDKTIKSNIEKVVYIIEDPYYGFNGFAHSDIPNGKIDKLSYQNAIGDCWLLASLDSLSELECGQDYLEQFIENDSEKQEVSIKLDGGKTVYTFSYDEINNAYKFSVGDADTKALEMAYDKYFKEFKPEGDDNIDGNWMRNAFAILSGNKPVDAIVLDGKAGIMMDGEFIEICKNNRDKLKHIPIDIQRVTPEIMAQIKEVQFFTPNTTVSANLDNYSSHAFYITDISDKNHITVKEPNSPNLARTYTQEYYFKVYDNLMTIFIM